MASTKFQFIFFVAFGLFIVNFVQKTNAYSCMSGDIKTFSPIVCTVSTCLTLRCDGVIHSRDCGNAEGSCPGEKCGKKTALCNVCNTGNNCNKDRN
uniref:Uncharacterized protein n=1 Tax=Meloidogyne enterolobii TaxID=390850 RepID=A0A6V7V044_MELEN|nr:unnamed protein product [Meloidogyne enterolobii]